MSLFFFVPDVISRACMRKYWPPKQGWFKKPRQQWLGGMTCGFNPTHPTFASCIYLDILQKYKGHYIILINV